MRQVLITGSSSGLGDGLARFLSSRNHNVFGISRHENFRLKKCASYTHIMLDLVKSDLVRKVLGNLFAEQRNWDLIVLNAGVLGEIADMRDVSVERMKEIMDINLWSNKLILDIIQDSGIRVEQIVAISSGASVNGNRGWNAYSVSKAALNMMIKLYAAEMSGVHLSALAPGLVDTGMQSYISSLPDDERFPSLNFLRSARGTSDMPTPLALAPALLEAMEYLKHNYPSGSFADIRTMELI